MWGSPGRFHNLFHVRWLIGCLAIVLVEEFTKFSIYSGFCYWILSFWMVGWNITYWPSNSQYTSIFRDSEILVSLLFFFLSLHVHRVETNTWLTKNLEFNLKNVHQKLEKGFWVSVVDLQSSTQNLMQECCVYLSAIVNVTVPFQHSITDLLIIIVLVVQNWQTNSVSW